MGAGEGVGGAGAAGSGEGGAGARPPTDLLTRRPAARPEGLSPSLGRPTLLSRPLPSSGTSLRPKKHLPVPSAPPR